MNDELDLTLLQQRISSLAVDQMVHAANNWRTGACTQRTVAIHDDWVRRLKCANNHVACGTHQGHVIVTDMDSGSDVAHFKPNSDKEAPRSQGLLVVSAEVTAMDFDGEHIVSGDATGSLYLRTRDRTVMHARHSGIVTGVHWDGGDVAYSTSDDRRFIAWSVPSAEAEEECLLPNAILSMSVCENYAALGLDGGTVAVYTLRPLRQLFTFEAHESSAICSIKLVTVSQLVTGFANGEVALWRLEEPEESGRRVTRFTGHQGPVIGLDGDSEKIASAARDGTVRVWDGEAGRLRFMLQGFTPYITSVQISPSWLIADGTNNAVVMMDFRNGAPGVEVEEG